jgi:hypothetical protein
MNANEIELWPKKSAFTFYDSSTAAGAILKVLTPGIMLGSNDGTMQNITAAR